MGFSRQYESGVPLPSLGELLDPGEINSGSPKLQIIFFFFFYYLCHQGNHPSIKNILL